MKTIEVVHIYLRGSGASKRKAYQLVPAMGQTADELRTSIERELTNHLDRRPVVYFYVISALKASIRLDRVESVEVVEVRAPEEPETH